MSRFRRRDRRVPGLNLASMPDLVFTVLFFFMIVTHMRETELKVRYTVPEGTEIEKSTRKSNVVYLFIGHPVDKHGAVTGGESQLQLNNRLIRLDELPQALAHERKLMSSEDRRNLEIQIQADRHTDMGLISDVKQRLRQAGVQRITYTATKKAQK